MNEKLKQVINGITVNESEVEDLANLLNGESKMVLWDYQLSTMVRWLLKKVVEQDEEIRELKSQKK